MTDLNAVAVAVGNLDARQDPRLAAFRLLSSVGKLPQNASGANHDLLTRLQNLAADSVADAIAEEMSAES